MAGTISPKPLGVALVGAGMVADTHVRALRDIADLARIVGVHARDAARLAAFCDPRGLTAAPDLERLVRAPEVDAVIVLTPPNARHAIVDLCLAAGKPILLEKPIERDGAAARAIVEAAEGAGVPLGVVFQTRYSPGFLALSRLMREGTLGPLACVRADLPWWRPQAYYDVEGRGTYARDGGGVLIAQAIHTLDLMRALAGPVAEVRAFAATSSLHRMEGEDFVAAGLRFASGAVGSVMATTAAYPGGGESLSLDCETGSAVLRSGSLAIAHHDGRRETVGASLGTGGGADPMAFSHGLHAAALRDFLQAVRAGRPPTMSGREALKVHDFVDALTASARLGPADAAAR